MRVHSIWLLLALLVCVSAASAKEPEEVWAELGRLSGSERQTRLMSGARAERKVVFYGNIESDNLERLRRDFEKRYPDIRLEIWRGSGERTANRVLTEARGGKFAADVIGPSNENLPTLMAAGLIGRYNSPERANYGDAHKDREGYWTSYDFNLVVMAYNTRLVPASQAPKKYEDFLAPKWKGNFAMDMDPDRAVMLWLKLWGEQKTQRFLQELSKNDVVIRKGHTLITQLLCAGEYKAAVELYAYRLATVKYEKGCPVEMSFPDPTPGGVTPIVVAKRSPNPHAAALLLDYILSEPGQKVLVDVGRFSGRRGLKPKYAEMDVEGKGIHVLPLRPEDAAQLGEKYQRLREKFLLARQSG
ncbi:MAG: extracellular solute-binding protein [Deltaproteobacteria bacterium]|nr:extracellular solute-binding protein [Deltaproteobacteria bacterium]